MTAAPNPAGRFVPDLYRPHQIAKVLGCSEWWVKEQARKRRIPFAWIGGSYRFTDEHLAEIIRLYEVRPATGGPEPAATRRTPRTARRAAPPAVPNQPRLRARPPARTPRAGPDPQGS